MKAIYTLYINLLHVVMMVSQSHKIIGGPEKCHEYMQLYIHKSKDVTSKIFVLLESELNMLYKCNASQK